MLSSEQIKYLFTFCLKHYIHFYEVQVELVDHFATSIEAELEKDPVISFEMALERTYKAFGGYKGMQRIQMEKQRFVEKENRRLKWNVFLSYFTWPKGAATALITLLTYLSLQYLPTEVLQIGLPIIIIGFFLMELRTISLVTHQEIPKKTPLLLLQGGGSLAFWFGGIILFNRLIDVIAECFSNPLGEVVLPKLLITITLPLYFVVIQCLKEYKVTLHQKAKDLYPEVF